MSETGRSRGNEQATYRGALVLVAAVALGLALLSRSSSGALIGPPGAGEAKPAVTTTAPPITLVPPNAGVTQPPPPSTTASTLPPTTHPADQVTVVVLNAAGGKVGVGGANADLIRAAGYNQVGVSNANATPVTTIYFADGYQGDAEAVKKAVNLAAAPLAAAPADPVVGAAAGANVIVVLGQDYEG